MKLKALVLEFAIQEGQHAPHLRLEIIHDVLVLHTQDEFWQYTVPVRHQSDVATIVVTDVEAVVREFLTLADWEQSMIIAALQRVASLMNAETLDASPVLHVADTATALAADTSSE